MKRTKDKIRAAQCPTCGKMMEKIEQWNEAFKCVEVVWRCTDRKCYQKKEG